MKPQACIFIHNWGERAQATKHQFKMGRVYVCFHVLLTKEAINAAQCNFWVSTRNRFA